MEAQARGASMVGGRGFMNGIVAVGALVVAMATGCAEAEEGVAAVPEPPTTKAAPEEEPAQQVAPTEPPAEEQTIAPEPPGIPMPPPYETDAEVECGRIQNGSNTVVVNGTSRTFLVQLPTDTSNMALMFQWHGFLQNSERFANEIVYDPPAGRWRAFDPNGFQMPLMLVTPVDKNLIPIWGLDWDIVAGARDFPYFEAMLKCIDTQFKIDRRRVYSFGFSAGAVFTNLLAAQYPKVFAATISESGAWFNDKKQWKDIVIPGTGSLFMKWKWPALDPTDGGAVMMTHGGPNDYATVISLENAALKALPFLKTGGRDVTECTHEFGHTLQPDITEAMYYQFMWDHQVGGPRQTALTAGLPTAEKPLFNSRCYLHRAP